MSRPQPAPHNPRFQTVIFPGSPWVTLYPPAQVPRDDGGCGRENSVYYATPRQGLDVVLQQLLYVVSYQRHLGGARGRLRATARHGSEAITREGVHGSAVTSQARGLGYHNFLGPVQLLFGETSWGLLGTEPR